LDFVYSLLGVEFEWDQRKARANLAKHQVRFEEAAEAFFDPAGQYGDASTVEEAREYVIGYSEALRLLLVVHTTRSARIRITSARRATPQERKLYEEA
jgi:uncharacterized protein